MLTGRCGNAPRIGLQNGDLVPVPASMIAADSPITPPPQTTIDPTDGRACIIFGCMPAWE